MQFLALSFVFVCLLAVSTAFLQKNIAHSLVRSQVQDKIQTALFAHHVQKKIVKKMNHRRPKKHRPSDINRNNVNHNKCITQMDLDTPDYTIHTAEEFEQFKAEIRDFIENGDPTAEWIDILPEDEAITIPKNTEPPLDPAPKVFRNYRRSRSLR